MSCPERRREMRRRRDGVGEAGMEGGRGLEKRSSSYVPPRCSILKCGLYSTINTNPLVALSHAAD